MSWIAAVLILLINVVSLVRPGKNPAPWVGKNNKWLYEQSEYYAQSYEPEKAKEKMVEAGKNMRMVQGVVVPQGQLNNVTNTLKRHIVILKETEARQDSVQRLSGIKALNSGNVSAFRIDDIIDFGFGSIQGAVIGLDDKTVELLKKESIVSIVEEDKKVQASTTQQGAGWNLSRLSHRGLPTDGTYTYNSAAGKGVDVYVLDSGILTTNTEFQGRATMGVDFTGQGLQDDLGHGTHVSGIVGGVNFGVAKQVNLIGVKVLGSDGSGSWSNVIAGMNWALSQAKQTGRKSIINMSLAGPTSQSINQAVNALAIAGFPVVVAAGNYGEDACQYSPASAAYAVAVGATDNTDAALTSPPTNIGQCVNILAPGGIIESSYIPTSTSTAYMSGTSMASPHVAGLLALYASCTDWNPFQLMEIVLNFFPTSGIVSGLGSTTPNVLTYAYPL